MANITKSYPDPVNIEALVDELVDGGYTSLTVRLDHVVIHGVTDDTPTNDDIDSIIAAHDDTVITDEQLGEASVSDLKAIKNKAEKVSDDIKALALAIMTSDESEDGLGARLTAIGTALDNSKAGFQSAFLAAFEAEYGTDVLVGGTLTLSAGIVALTTSQRREFIRFARNLLPMYVILLKL